MSAVPASSSSSSFAETTSPLDVDEIVDEVSDAMQKIEAAEQHTAAPHKRKLDQLVTEREKFLKTVEERVATFRETCMVDGKKLDREIAMVHSEMIESYTPYQTHRLVLPKLKKRIETIQLARNMIVGKRIYVTYGGDTSDMWDDLYDDNVDESHVQSQLKTWSICVIPCSVHVAMTSKRGMHFGYENDVEWEVDEREPRFVVIHAAENTKEITLDLNDAKSEDRVSFVFDPADYADDQKVHDVNVEGEVKDGFGWSGVAHVPAFAWLYVCPASTDDAQTQTKQLALIDAEIEKQAAFIREKIDAAVGACAPHAPVGAGAPHAPVGAGAPHAPRL